jgi:quercetin dioxygenase-like cupin family protein
MRLPEPILRSWAMRGLTVSLTLLLYGGVRPVDAQNLDAADVHVTLDSALRIAQQAAVSIFPELSDFLLYSIAPRVLKADPGGLHWEVRWQAREFPHRRWLVVRVYMDDGHTGAERQDEDPLGSGQAQGTGSACIPAAQRAGREFGCFILASHPVGRLGKGPTFWHLSTLPARADARTVGEAEGTVVGALGQVWLLTIAGADWRPSTGSHVAAIGPLPVTRGVSYTAQFMEAVFRPGMKSAVHRHSGPEAWYTLAGETCLETPDGSMIGRAGGPPVIVPHGPPMELTATGTAARRALVLILHDSAQPATVPATDWMPKGLCKVSK